MDTLTAVTRSLVRAGEHGRAVGVVPVLLAPRLLEVLPRETFRRTQLELQVIEISLLCLSLQVEITCINYTIKTKMSAMKISNINPHLPH